MEKSIQLRNLRIIINFIFDEVFKGILNRGFFKLKANKIIFPLVLFIMYCAYFYTNLYQAAILNSNGPSGSIETIKYLISSFTNTTVIISILIFLIVNITFNLNTTTLFTLKRLPFTNKEISLAQKIFKGFLGLAIFEFLLIVMLPSLVLIQISAVDIIIYILFIHIVFLIGYFTCQMFSSFFSSNKGFFLYNASLIVCSIFYMFNIRFKIDRVVATSSLIINTYSLLTMLIVSIILLITILFIVYYSKNKDHIFIKSEFFNIKVINGHKNFVLLSLIRTKKFIILVSLIFFSGIIMLVGFRTNSNLLYLSFLYLVIPFVGISYSDNNYNFKFTLKMYGINFLKEYVLIQLTNIIFVIPLILMLYFYQDKNESIKLIILFVTLFNISISMGLIFPKKLSSINETFATLMSIILSVVVVATISNVSYVFISMIISNILMLIILVQGSDKT